MFGAFFVNAINSTLLAELSDALELGTPERCGILTADGHLVEIPNIHADPVKGFHMEPVAFLACLEAGAVATWHTHPGKDPNLSEEDMRGFLQWPMLTHHIVGIRDGEPTVHSFGVKHGQLVNLK